MDIIGVQNSQFNPSLELGATSIVALDVLLEDTQDSMFCPQIIEASLARDCKELWSHTEHNGIWSTSDAQ